MSTPLWLGENGVAATVAKSMGVTPEEARRRIIEGGGGFSSGRFTEPEEVADLAVLLASERAGNVTGADFLIDGGVHEGALNARTTTRRRHDAVEHSGRLIDGRWIDIQRLGAAKAGFT